MDKPEDVRQLARTIVLVCQYTWPKDREKNVQKAEKLLETFVSEAILSAQSQAYIDAARVTDEMVEIACDAYNQNFSPNRFSDNMRRALEAALSAAILQRKEEIGR